MVNNTSSWLECKTDHFLRVIPKASVFHSWERSYFSVQVGKRQWVRISSLITWSCYQWVKSVIHYLALIINTPCFLIMCIIIINISNFYENKCFKILPKADVCTGSILNKRMIRMWPGTKTTLLYDIINQFLLKMTQWYSVYVLYICKNICKKWFCFVFIRETEPNKSDFFLHVRAF